jgi:3-hydroxybutyryl-CoA dehydratase
MTEAERQPEVHGPDDLYPGMTSSFQVTFDDALLRSFSELSGDWNPLHNDEEYAQGRGFAHRVAHGATPTRRR